MFHFKAKPALEASTLGLVAFESEPEWPLETVRASPTIGAR